MLREKVGQWPLALRYLLSEPKAFRDNMYENDTNLAPYGYMIFFFSMRAKMLKAIKIEAKFHINIFFFKTVYLLLKKECILVSPQTILSFCTMQSLQVFRGL